jgi:multiple inositol-polyphosphate phosphatase / 2,3-bisphosphoglycerate 3-phosphatase
MKKRTCYHLITIAILYLLPLKNIAQSQALFLGTKTPYPAPAKNNYTVAPAGFKPVFINYTGRHGSRFLTKAGSDITVLQVLVLAEKNNQLTDLGKQIARMTERFLTIEKDNYENITLLGEEEQTGIGKRMLDNYSNAFKGNGLEIVTTHKKRTRQSADAFLKAFSTYTGKKKYRAAPDSLDDVLRFYDVAPAYEEYKNASLVQNSIDSLDNDPRTKSTAANVCSKIFTSPLAATDAVSFAKKLHDLYCVQFSVPEEMKHKGFTNDSIDFGIAFEQKDLEWLDFLDGAEDFLEKGPGPDTLGIQVKVAVPLLADYITSTDQFIHKTRKADAILRFTHAEAISPFATLLGIPIASIPSASVYSYNKHWKAASIIPLSANINWILYCNGKQYLVKVLLNEKETALPIPTTTYPFYKWNDVKEYYEKKMRLLQADPKQDMHKYLLELK